MLGRALYPLTEDKEKVEVVTLLPLSLYVNQENKQKYSELLKGKYSVSNTNGVKKSFTQEKGMNIFYSELGKVLTSKLLESYSDKDSELLYKKYDQLSEEMKSIIDDFAKNFIKECSMEQC